MKKWKKRLVICFVLVALIGVCGGIAYSKINVKADRNLSKDTFVEDAVLYTITPSGELEYNVTYYGNAKSAEIEDATFNGIDTLEKLREVLGTADLPEAKLTVDPGVRSIGKVVIADLVLDGSGSISSVVITDISERPVVGISWKKDSIGSDYKRFAESLERNGALAVYLPEAADDDATRDILSALDGIFFTGGEDLNPSLYGEDAITHGASGWNDNRDASDQRLMKLAIEMDLPLLAVCRGMQGLNVALGGALIQDIPLYLGDKVLSGEISAERVTEVLSGVLPGEDKVIKDKGCDEPHLRVWVDGLVHSKGTRYHELTGGTDGFGISEDSKWLYSIFQSNSLEYVATAHHQGVDPDRVGDGLSVAAVSSDGIIEAIEYRGNLFALGVQWHPERDSLTDLYAVDVDQDTCNAILRELVRYAQIYNSQN